MSHSSWYQPVVTSVRYVSPVRIPTATFPPHIPKISYINASIWSVSSRIKTASLHKSALSSHQTSVSTKTFRTPITPYLEKFSSTWSLFTHQTNKILILSLLQNFLFHHVRPVTGSPQFVVPFLPSNTLDSSVISLNLSYVVRSKPLYLKLQNLWFWNIWRLLKPQSALNLLSDSINTSTSCVSLVQHSIFNSKQKVHLDSFNSDDIYLSSLGKFSSSVAIKCFLTFLSLLVSFSTLCYSSKVSLSFYLVFLAFLISYFLLTQSSCVVLNLSISTYIFLLILFFFAKVLKFFYEFFQLFALQNLTNATIFSVY